MLHKKTIIWKLFWFFFLFSGQLIYASDSDFLFIENKGQNPINVEAKVNLPGGSLFIEKGVFTYHFFDQQKLADFHNLRKIERNMKTHAFKVKFKNANKDMQIILKEKARFFENYFIGNDRNKWAEKVCHYKTLYQKNLYEGVDLKMYVMEKDLKYDLIVQPNTNPKKIKLSYKGVDNIFLKNGNCYVQTSVNTIIEKKPFAYQIIKGKKKEIACNYKLKGKILSFEFPSGYDNKKNLIIDPTLIFSTYSGSIANNFGYTATYDNYGFLYAGSTAFGLGYPTTFGAYQINFAGGTVNGGTDLAITKYDTSGMIAIYSTYLGGSKDELPHSMIINSANELFLFGTSGSDDYPTTTNAYQTTFNGGPSFLPSGIGISYPDGCDLIVSCLSSNGGNLLASTFIGGSENDGINIANKLKFNYADEVRGEIDIDKNNNIYIATCSRSADFPIVGNVFQSTLDSLQEGVIIKMDNQLENIIWSSFIGGRGVDAIYSLALDDGDNIYVTGGTTSDNFPTSSNALHSNYLDSLHADAFVSYISKDGAQIISSTYFGSSEYDQAYFVELDRAENVYLFGQTKATDNTFIHQANYNVSGGGEFISKLSKNLDILLQSTVVGANTGNPNISPTAFLVDVCNKIYIAGWGSSIGVGNAGTTFNLPTTTNAFQNTTDGNDFYLMVLDGNMNNLIYATYFGGNQATEHVDGGTSRFDKKGIVYQCVCAGCGGHSDFPTTSGALSATNNAASGSQCNSAVFKFDFDFPMTIADFSAPWVSCDTTISFQNLSTGRSNTTYQWFFGEGNNSTQENPTHSYSQNGIYDVMLIASDPTSCNISDTIIKKIYILSNSSRTIDTVDICKNEQIQIGLLPVNDPSVSYFWAPPYGLSSITVPNPFVNADSTINYQLLISNGNCMDTVFQFVKVNEIQIDVGNDTSICNNPILLRANTNGLATDILWSSNNNFGDTLGVDSVLLVSNPQYYFVKIRDGNCEAIDSVELQTQNIDITLNGNFSLCLGDSAFIKVNNLLSRVPLIKYDWTPNANFNFNIDSSSISFFPDSSVWVFVEVQNQDGCILKDSVFIAVNSHPIIDSVWASKNPIYKGENITLNIQTSYNVLWETGDTNLQIEVAPISDSLFRMEVYSDLDCSIFDSIYIQILDVFCDENKIIIPTAFTPNNITPNNTYRIKDIDNIITSFKLEIFNRFGQKVYASTNKFEKWNGTFQNELLAPQVFDFYLQLECFGGKRLFKKGNITLIR